MGNTMLYLSDLLMQPKETLCCSQDTEWGRPRTNPVAPGQKQQRPEARPACQPCLSTKASSDAVQDQHLITALLRTIAMGSTPHAVGSVGCWGEEASSRNIIARQPRLKYERRHTLHRPPPQKKGKCSQTGLDGNLYSTAN